MASREPVVESTAATLEEARGLASLLGTFNESNRASQITINASSALAWQSIPLNVVRESTRREIRAARETLARIYPQEIKKEFLRAERTSGNEAQERLAILISTKLREARDLGLRAMGREATSAFDLRSMRAVVDEETRYAMRFLDDFLNAEGRQELENRFALYGRTVRQQFNIAAYHAVTMRTRIFWEMSAFSACEDCLMLAADSPYTGDFGERPLPTVPQAGLTKCISNCDCYLRFESDAAYVGTEPDMSYEIEEFEEEAVSDEWLRSNKGRAVQRALNDRFRSMAHHYQLAKVGMSGHEKKALGLEQALAAYVAANGIVATPRAQSNDYIAPVEGLIDDEFEPIDGPSVFEGEAVILRGLRVTIGEASRISESAVRMRLINGRERVYSHGDKAGASLWVRAKE